MRHRILRLLCLLAVGLILFDDVLDGAGCEDPAGSEATCHACACGSHIAPQASTVVSVAPAPTAYAPRETPSYAFLPRRLIFHPPRLPA